MELECLGDQHDEHLKAFLIEHYLALLSVVVVERPRAMGSRPRPHSEGV